ncbi:MAG: ABC transporter ATP-binding protein [Lachnospiraceae bacterium]|nr:ABC transporter ATP-binding protein [Lachnospiraceae bacterium]
MMKRLIGYYKPYRKIFYTDMFFALLSAVAALILPLAVRYVAYTVVYEETSAAVTHLLLIGAGLVLLVGLQCYSNYYIANYGHVMGAKIEYDMRAEIFAHYQKLSFTFFDDQKVGQLMSRITSDLFDITELLHHGPENLVISFIKLVGAFIILFSINATLAFTAFSLVPFMLLYAYYFNKRMKKAFRQNRIKIAAINEQIEDNLSGIRVVKSFANEAVEEEKFRRGNDGFLSAKKNSYHYMGGYNSGLNAFTNLITVLVLVVGGWQVIHQTLEATDLMAFVLYIHVFTDPVRVLIDFTEQFQNGYSGYERFVEILEIEPDIQDAPDAKELQDVRGDVSFRNVSFHYPRDEHKVLSNVSLDVKAGEYVALVGASGVGKTTLCSLIPRFYEVDEGSVLIDGMDVRDLTQRSLRSRIGIVQQDVYLFAGSVMENIRYGRPDATEDEVVEAAKRANAHEFILSLPDGYATDIGQRGVKLSGGQKQRLSIARVFLKNPPILIFDEATSALDNESEKVVQESLESLAKDRTTFVIAHRLSTIRNAGRILVLTEKGVEEEGTHRELMEKKGAYYHLYEAGTV